MLPAETRPEPRRPFHAQVAWAVAALGLYAVLGAVTSFAGWLLDLPRLTDWLGSGISIQPNATLAVAATGAALLLLAGGRDRAAAGCGLAVAAIGLATLAQYLVGVNFDAFNTLLMFERPWGRVGVLYPGRMGPPGSLCWSLLGTALALRGWWRDSPRARRVAASIGLVTLCVATLSITGYVFGTDRLYALPYLTVISLQTATFIAAASLALLASVPERAPVRWLGEPGAAGDVARRALPFIVVVPFVLGWLSKKGLEWEWYDPPFRAALFVLVLIVLLLALLSWTLGSIARHEAALRRSEQRLSAALAERVEAERALRDADQRKDAFIATLAHELRGPLAPVMTALDLLSRDGLEPAVAARARLTMRRQLRQMVRLIEDLLDVGRISRDKLELRPAPVALRPLLEQSVESCEPLRQRAEHELVLDLPDAALWLLADGPRLVQVFGNVLGNACKYTPPGGRIELSVRRLGARVEIAVRDSGQGIPADQLEAVFEPFCQLGKGLEQQHGGLGIGLYLARRLARLHGGDLVAQSDGPGCGSLFTIRLPLAARDEARHAADEGARGIAPPA